MTTPDPGRWAIYWAPERDHPIWTLGTAWLGGDPETGARLDSPVPADLRETLRDPARYGLHATLKPPFPLAPGTSPASLIGALAQFTAPRRPFMLPPLALTWIGRFLALTPSAPAPEIDALGADCVRGFDRFRRSPTPAELERRRAVGLDAAQEARLVTWGYPHVLEGFRLHLSLTGRVTPEQRAALEPIARRYFEPLHALPVSVESLALYHEPRPGAPFRLVQRLGFGTATPSHVAPRPTPTDLEA